jgi:hypothetical protein
MPASGDPNNRRAALEGAKGLNPTPSNIDRLAKRVGAEDARWAFAQWDLRRRARSKFAGADEMLFVREALEQATASPVADYHASLFPAGELVADLTCGIGGDLMALAARGPAIGFELDPERVLAARHNVGERAEVCEADSLSVSWTWEYALADPARRVEGRRTIDPSQFSPDPIVIAARFADLKLGVQKLSPLLEDSFLLSLGPSLRFVSFQDECREALVLAGSEARPERGAVHVESGEWLEAGPDAPEAETPGEYFYDCDPACVRAHAIGTLADRLGLAGLGDSRGYLTGDLVASPWLRAYRVLYHGKGDWASTKKALISLGSGTPELKQRHAGQDLVKLQKSLKLGGARRLSVAIWPVGRSLRHSIIEAEPRKSE